jgi:ribosomal protein S18 acetylase RimI-like enzyme
MFYAGHLDVRQIRRRAQTVDHRRSPIIEGPVTGISSAGPKAMVKHISRIAFGFAQPANQKRRIRFACTRTSRRVPTTLKPCKYEDPTYERSYTPAMTTDTSSGRVHPTLVPMSADEFTAWQEASIRSFAQDLAQSTGRPLGAALQQAGQQFAELLPDGLDTERVHLLRVVDETEGVVGTLWTGPQPGRAGAAHVYDIEIKPEYRGRGFGRAAMLAAEVVALVDGATVLGLNVFGFNETALRLYKSLGYSVVATQMSNTL